MLVGGMTPLNMPSQAAQMNSSVGKKYIIEMRYSGYILKEKIIWWPEDSKNQKKIPFFFTKKDFTT